MAYDQDLAERVRRLLEGTGALEEKRMMGGLCFMLDGHMCCGVNGSDLMVRTGAERHAEMLTRPHARPMDFTGKPLRGFVWVAPDGTASEPQLSEWVEDAIQLVRTLPRR
jgi:TfoX/Sxy family transcriptional regulator of competence genes